MPLSLTPRIRDPLLFLLSLLLAVSAIRPNANGNVAAAQVLSESIKDGGISDNDNIDNYIASEGNGAGQYEDEDNNDTEKESYNGDENNVDYNDIPPVYFSLLPISNPKEANTEVQLVDPSTVLKLTLYFMPMFPIASQSNPLLRNIYKAYHSFEEGPIDAEWATFEGGPPGLAKTKCTIEGHDDFEISNFMRSGETRVDIRGADYIWCVTTL